MEIFYEVSFEGTTSVGYINLQFFILYGMILATCAHMEDTACKCRGMPFISTLGTLQDMVDEVPCAKKHRKSGGNIFQHCKVVDSYLLVSIMEEAEDSVFFFTHSLSHFC